MRNWGGIPELTKGCRVEASLEKKENNRKTKKEIVRSKLRKEQRGRRKVNFIHSSSSKVGSVKSITTHKEWTKQTISRVHLDNSQTVKSLDC